jgi:hypothetical protein
LATSLWVSGGSRTCRLRALERSPPEPHVAEQELQSDQSPQEQVYTSSTHVAAHDITLVTGPWQATPPPAAGCAKPRVRLLMFDVVLQSLHFVQSAHVQLTGVGKHFTPAWHEMVSLKDSGQDLPPFSGCISTVRRRHWFPRSQVPEQPDQSDQSLITQSCASSTVQLGGSGSPSAGLHLDVISRVPSHALPSPMALERIFRVRTLLPWHSDEHADGADHLLKTQSWCWLQGSAAQPPNSTSEPGAGCPHHVSFLAIGRRLWRVPLPQLALHAPHSAQSPQLPSMQHSGWPLQFGTGMTSSLIRGGQSCPPPLGKAEMLRFRRL